LNNFKSPKLKNKSGGDFFIKTFEFAVIFGGKSCENEISVITGTMACNLLKNAQKSVLPLYISQQGDLFCGEELLDINNFKSGAQSKKQPAIFVKGGVALLNKKGKIKNYISVGCLINCCHGGIEEGGAISSLCSFYSIPLVGSGIFSSSACINKYFTKLALNGLGVKCAPWQLVNSLGDIPQAIAKIGLPVVVKPRNLGSSIGVALAHTEQEVAEAMQNALYLDDAVILEKYLQGRRELNCAAYFNGSEVITSECEEVLSSGELLSYDDKYSGGGASCFPAKISEQISAQIKDTTKKVYTALEMNGIVRMDYIISQGEVYLCEVNTVPGSLSHYLLTENFSQFTSLLCNLAAVAKNRYAILSQKGVINTGILDNLNANACKIK